MMNLAQLEEQLPNGFHDALLLRLDVDYRQGLVVMDLALWVSDLDGGERDLYRNGRLTVRGLELLVIEPPEEPLQPGGDLVWISGDSPEPGGCPPIDGLVPRLTCECYRFYVHTWNSFIYMAAGTADLQWIEDEAHPL